MPAAVGGGVPRVGAVALVAGQARRQDLAGRLGRERSAVADDGAPAVQGQVDGLAHAQVVERRGVDVEGQETGDQLRVDPELAPVALEVGGAGRDLADAEQEVARAVGDRGRAAGPAEVEADQDPVRVAGRLGRGRPFAEARVADHEQVLSRGVAADHVRAGGRQRCPGLSARGRRGQHVGVGEGQLGQEVRIGLGEVEGHGAGAVVRGDAAGQITGRGGLQARGGAADGLVGGRASAAELEQALEGAGDVAGPDERAGRIADARAQAERVGASVVGGRGQRQREVRDQPGAARPGHVVQRDQPVVGQAEKLRRGHVGRVAAAGSIVSTFPSE